MSGFSKASPASQRVSGFGFHLMTRRDAAVTTWAIARPDQICVSRDLLYHSKLDTPTSTTEPEAHRVYRQVITETRRKSNRAPVDS